MSETFCLRKSIVTPDTAYCKAKKGPQGSLISHRTNSQLYPLDGFAVLPGFDVVFYVV